MTVGEGIAWLIVVALGCMNIWLLIERAKRKDSQDPMQHPYGDWPRGKP